VVIPNPKLSWDQAGIPVLVLLELMDDILKAWLGRMRPNDRAKLPELQMVSWLRPRENPQGIDDGLTIIKAYLEEHPDFVVLLNRQPSLHRDSVQAFHPVPLQPDSGEVIQICPLACKGFGADFDGDEMVVHLPLGPQAQAEAVKMLPSNNLLSLGFEAPNNVTAHFDQDFVLGTWWMCQDEPKGTRDVMRKIFPKSCQKLIPDATTENFKSKPQSLLHHLAVAHRDPAAACIHSWMTEAFKACTLNGVSFGYYELRELARMANKEGKVTAICKERSDDANKKMNDLSLDTLREFLAKGIPEPSAHVAAMALSEARGEKQIRQIVAARGFLDPGTTAHECKRDEFFISSSLVQGMTPTEAFQGAMNARSSMCDKKLGTAYAGGLTRSLVFALWPYQIVSNDCGNAVEGRNPVSCTVKHGFCAECYGVLSDGKRPSVRFPVGLIAAQTIGERGTQLSMQSFHGSESAVNIQWVPVRPPIAGGRIRAKYEGGKSLSAP